MNTTIITPNEATNQTTIFNFNCHFQFMPISLACYNIPIVVIIVTNITVSLMCAFPIDGHIFHVCMPIKVMLPKKSPTI